MLEYKLLCKQKTLSCDVGSITKVTGQKEYWIKFCNKFPDAWEFLGEVDSIESAPVKPIVAKPIKYLNRVNNNNL